MWNRRIEKYLIPFVFPLLQLSKVFKLPFNEQVLNVEGDEDVIPRLLIFEAMEGAFVKTLQDLNGKLSANSTVLKAVYNKYKAALKVPNGISQSFTMTFFTTSLFLAGFLALNKFATSFPEGADLQALFDALAKENKYSSKIKLDINRNKINKPSLVTSMVPTIVALSSVENACIVYSDTKMVDEISTHLRDYFSDSIFANTKAPLKGPLTIQSTAQFFDFIAKPELSNGKLPDLVMSSSHLLHSFSMLLCIDGFNRFELNDEKEAANVATQIGSYFPAGTSFKVPSYHSPPLLMISPHSTCW